MKRISLFLALSTACMLMQAQQFETATEAVANMGIGWNLGNTLDANAGDTTNMWIERWTPHQPADYENAWGQVPTTRALIHLFKEAGFGCIRVPVTWYPHMGVVLASDGNWHKSQWQPAPVDDIWMNRVQETVDYIIDEGMYCILDVHHDTGAATTAWIRATMADFQATDSVFRDLWTQIATRFRDYDEHLIFEGYNEMLDGDNSWCFASFNAPGQYSAARATDAYQAINSYAAAFVEAVRATGGNNLQRNLMVNPYAAASGMGTWNVHLQDPFTQFVVPTDPCGTQDHLMISVHTYPALQSNGRFYSNSQITQQNRQFVDGLKQLLQTGKNMPVVVGEWGSSNVDADITDYELNPSAYLHFVSDMVSQCLEAGICPIYWMGLSDGQHRNVPEFNQPDIVRSMTSSAGQTALTDVRKEEKAHKMLINGQLYIFRDGKTYSAVGIETTL